MILKDIPITDDHMHIDPVNGKGIKAALEFKRSGGTHIFLVTKPSWSFGITPQSGEDFRPVFEKTIQLADEITENGVKTFPILGVHPAEIGKLTAAGMTVEEAADVMSAGLTVAAEYVRNGEAVALKSGRPHYEVTPDVWDASNRVLAHAIALAHDADCALQIHAETGPCEDVVTMAQKSGMDIHRIVKHFGIPETPLTPSLIAKHEAIPDLARQGRLFTMESDYMDENSRPGSVIGPKSVPRFTRKLIESGKITEEQAYKIHKDNPEKIYGVEINLG
ncbi:TatD family hydrolase [Methanoplanus endosymbiosus]|uniref:TatD family hydrolase n=1 Tax=Methanoplanus endosymbiosus TaxID=33865 RepID=A0A9E7PL03_9EURY|nr:TatD family hydrolase [Methanoplanus endosymbiosus]UUX92108.1 TatD family hydrolase [Methanoplanus endosymbiosus]